jgi:1-acyl-sn-glycerol-3-phosphate acyltransferase
MKEKIIAPQRILLSNKIDELEAKGMFDVDVNIDPPTIPLKPNQVDYEYKKISTRVKASIANFVAKIYFEKQIKNQKLIIKEITGENNLLKVNKGAIITCNHFHPFDNYAVYKAIEPYLGKKKLFKVIREGNYTNFPGLYGYFFRNCNTLPLAKDPKVMKEFSLGLAKHLKDGHKVLIYPEQAMWLNYKKPRPLKLGAFKFAAENNVPIIPIFITMEDSIFLDDDNALVQSLSVHIMKPIGVDTDLNTFENATRMQKVAFERMKNKYEEVYKIPLSYKGSK